MELCSGLLHCMSNHRLPYSSHTKLRSVVLFLMLLSGFGSLAGAMAQSKAPQHRKPAPKILPRPSAGHFAERVDSALAQGQAPKAHWGIVVADESTGEILYERDGEHFFVPASNTKLFTSAFALAALGPDHRFRTTIETSGTIQPDGRLAADIVLVGRGDPDISNRKFPYEHTAEREGPAEKVLAEMADEVVSRGVKEIDGDVVADDSYFAYDPYPEGWTNGDLYFGFGAPVSAISLDDNTLTVTVQPGAQMGDPPAITVSPRSAAETFGHEIVTGPSASRPQFSVVREPGPNPIFLRGSVPAGGAAAHVDIALEHPAEYAAEVLKELLIARGVHVTGEARAHHGPPPYREAHAPTALAPPPAYFTALAQAEKNNATGQTPAGRTVLSEHQSPPLLQIIGALNKVSENLHAEMLLRDIAREKAGIGTTDAGIELEQNFFKASGVPADEILLADGSGLSRQNLVTPRATVKFLQYVLGQSWAQGFLSALPVAGIDGTLEDRLKNTPAAGRVRAKTGSLEHTHALSGYATSIHGSQLAFSIFCDDDPAQPHATSQVVDAIVIAMVEEFRPSPPARK
jgi:D-alanyl-D-alanine carboxypeptidase/D-alanyl-D-alanine-endopeptidase (penicillin-binding protein 4)